MSLEDLARELAIEPGDTTWKKDGACVGSPSDWWFPNPGDRAHKAIQICRTCSVRAECLDYAITTNQTGGIWGGYGSKNRQDIARLRRARRTA